MIPVKWIENRQGIPLPPDSTKLSDDLWVEVISDGHWMAFRFLSFHSACEEEIRVNCFLYGEGCIGLKECRHTYWGEEEHGYIFYPNKDHITRSLDWLSQYFDI